MTTYTYKKLKEKHDLLEKEFEKFRDGIDEFFGDKVFTKLPFGLGKNQFYLEVMLSKQDYERVLKFNTFHHALLNAKEIDPPPEELEKLKEDAEKQTQEKLDEIFNDDEMKREESKVET